MTFCVFKLSHGRSAGWSSASTYCIFDSSSADFVSWYSNSWNLIHLFPRTLLMSCSTFLITLQSFFPDPHETLLMDSGDDRPSLFQLRSAEKGQRQQHFNPGKQDLQCNPEFMIQRFSCIHVIYYCFKWQFAIIRSCVLNRCGIMVSSQIGRGFPHASQISLLMVIRWDGSNLHLIKNTSGKHYIFHLMFHKRIWWSFFRKYNHFLLKEKITFFGRRRKTQLFLSCYSVCYTLVFMLE